MEYVQAYNKHMFLFDGDNEDELDAYINEERTWDQLAAEVIKFHNLSQEIGTEFEPKTVIGIFDVHCDDLIKGLAQKAAEIRDKFLDRMIHDLHIQLKE
jgi:dynein heavy chain